MFVIVSMFEIRNTDNWKSSQYFRMYGPNRGVGGGGGWRNKYGSELTFETLQVLGQLKTYYTQTLISQISQYIWCIIICRVLPFGGGWVGAGSSHPLLIPSLPDPEYSIEMSGFNLYSVSFHVFCI